MRSRRRKLGLAFQDELLKTTGRSGHFRKRKPGGDGWEDSFIPNYRSEDLFEPVSPWRMVSVAAFILIMFFGIFLRLFHLQIVEGWENRERADSNRIQMRVVHAPRGVVYDRNGKVLAENNPGFRLEKEFLSRDEALLLEAKGDPKFDELEIDAVRYYPGGAALAHVLGYVGQISEEELEDVRYRDYRLGDRIGRSGVEQIYESVLRGTDGAEIIEVDAAGKKLRTIRKIEPVPGNNLHLSLDADFQKAAFEALVRGVEKAGVCCGAVVAEDPQTGEVLALASLPSFDPNVFTDPTRSEEAARLFNDGNAPLFNRVISGTYPPGSTFKITSALAGLSSGKVKAETRVEDTGVMSLGPYKFANWYFIQHGKTEGLVDLVKALQRSNDIFFYRVGEWVGVETLGETARKLGMGKRLGIDLPNEADGVIPNNEWKKENIGEIWYPGDTLHMAIGQGFLLATPLQILAQTAFIAGEGVLVQPHLALKITSPGGEIVKQFHYEPVVKNLFRKEDLEQVKKGLGLVPKEGGTAWPFFNFTVPTAGKTGTAETGDPKGRTHAWYVSYAPESEPQIAVTVLVEKGGEGSSVAAPIVKDLYTWYFNPDKGSLKSLDRVPVSTSAAVHLGE